MTGSAGSGSVPVLVPKGLSLSAFTVDAASALPGPPWLRKRRMAAAEQFEAAGLPSTDEEVWRYSRVADFDPDAYRLVAGPADEAPAAALEVDGAIAVTVSVVSGAIASVVVAPDLAAKGLWVGALADAPDGADALGSVAAEPADTFGLMNDAFCQAPLLVRVPRGVTVEAPIVVVHSGGAEGTAIFPRLVVQAGDGSACSVVEQFSAAGAVFVAPVTELGLGRGARLGYACIQDLGLEAWQIASQVSSVGQEATLVSASGGLGGDYARLRTDCRLEGRGASGDLISAYFGEGDQTLDFRTFQDHRAPDTTSNLLFKGAVGGRSRSVYTGLIRVRKEARGTNAFQTNRNIKLSEDAWAESVPNLEIENNDVHCSHASAVGPIDEEQRFYLESRGVPPQVAERLVVSGFFDEVIRRMPAPGLATPLRRRIAAKLDRSFTADRPHDRSEVDR